MNPNPEDNKTLLYNSLFWTIDNKNILFDYLKLIFQFVPKKGFEFIQISNTLNLPYFIAQKTFDGLLHNMSNVDIDEFIKRIIDFHFGDLENMIESVFHILDVGRENAISIDNVKIFFAHILLFNKNDENSELKQIGFEIIDSFFDSKTKMSRIEYKEKIFNDNSDLFYLIYFFYIENCFINTDSYSHFEKKFYSVNHTLTSIDDEEQRAKNKETFERVQLPSGLLYEFLNKKFYYSFTLNDDLEELTQFENEFIKCRHRSVVKQNSIAELPKSNSHLNLVQVARLNSDKGVVGVKTKGSSKSFTFDCNSISILDDNKNANIEIFILKNNAFVTYYIDFIGNVIFIHKNSRELKYILPIQQMYFEIPQSTYKASGNEEYIANGYYALTLYSLMTNRVKKFTFYFKNKSAMNRLCTAIESNKSEKTFDNTRYTNIEIIDQGSFGQIIKALDTITKKDVAIKVINKNYSDIEMVKLLRNEIDIASVLKETSHPGIVEILEIGETKDQLYFVEKYYKEGNLQKFLKRNTLTTQQQEDMIKQLAEAIDFLHSYGIVHRDLKLENILVDTSNNTIQTKIIDFGLSKIASSNEKMEEKYGTLLYLPPEIILNTKYTSKIDIWDFGIIAFSIINSGIHPLSGESEMDNLLQKIILHDFNFAKINAKYKQLLSNCLQKENKRANSKEVLLLLKSII